MRFPFPDWQKTRVAFADPAAWPRYTRSRSNLRRLFRELVGVLRVWGVSVEILRGRDAPLDIWIRDWGFVEGAFFRYAPDYACGLYSQRAVARARAALVRRLGVRCRSLPLVLDGGNLVHNGTVAIVTEKVFRENPHFTRSEIECGIVALGFERVVFIPNEPGDEIGHSDGMCRFVSKRVLLVNDYASAEMRSFGQRLHRVLRAAKLNSELVPFPWFSRSGRSDGVPSAEGCYMNFLQLAQGIIVPAFSHSKDGDAVESLTGLTQSPIASVVATPLAKLGGVFNCISLTF